MDSGFEGASTDEIVRRAGVSKGTVYKYFPDKASLFEAVIMRECSEQSRRVAELAVGDGSVRDRLGGLAGIYIEFLLSPFAQQIYRIAVGESRRFPEVGKAFYRSGPELVCRLLGEQLAGMDELRVADPGLAAKQFVELCRAEFYFDVLFGVRKRVPKKEIEAAGGRVVDLFLKVYAVD